MVNAAILRKASCSSVCVLCGDAEIEHDVAVASYLSIEYQPIALPAEGRQEIRNHKGSSETNPQRPVAGVRNCVRQ